jgi:hypothetical protein
MSSKNGFLDEQGMVDLARKTIEDLRKEGVSPTELKRLENILKEGGRWGVSHSVWVIKNDSKRDFAGRLAKKTPADL